MNTLFDRPDFVCFGMAVIFIGATYLIKKFADSINRPKRRRRWRY